MGVTSLRLSKDNEAPLDKLAKRLDRSKNYLINQAIKEYIARQMMEDERWVDTLAALNSVKSNQLIGESEVTEWLLSWGTDKEQNPPSV